MRIETGPIWSRLTGADTPTLLRLEEKFKVKVPGARFVPSVRAGFWDGCVRYFKPVSGAFLTGFLPDVLLDLQENGQLPEVVRTYVMPRVTRVPLENREPFEIRDYQESIVREALALKRGVIKAATNAGKTEIAMEICRRLALPTLYLVTEQTLWDQTYERFRARLGDDVVGRAGAGAWDPKLITVAMVQTVAPKIGSGAFGDVKVLIADEVHLFTGDKKKRADEGGKVKRPPANWQVVLQKIPAPYRFGMSGTPITETETRDMNLIGLTGPLFADVSNRELVDRGFSALPNIVFVRYRGLPRKVKWHDDVYREFIVECKERNEAIADICRAHKGEQVLVMCNWAEHTRVVKRALNGAGIDSVVLTGRDDVRSRKRWLAAFKAGRIQALITTTIADQGWDVPEIDVLIMAGGLGVSPVKPLQRLGRSLRRRPDKDEVSVYDFMDEYQKDTERHSKRRVQLFKRESFAVSVKGIADVKEGR